jgi:hypothetical protein
LFATYKVRQLVIDSEDELFFGYMPLKKRTVLKKIEEDTPARDFGVPITTRVVLPNIPVFILDRLDG